MSGESVQIEIRVEMTREEAWEFLRQVTTDDDFRGRLQADAGTTLAECGIFVSGPLPETVTLPSREEVEELARVVAPTLRLEGDAWVGLKGGQFITCLWLAVGFAAAHRAVVPDGPVAS